MLSSYRSRPVHKPSAFHEGMRFAILQLNYEALLIFVELADSFAMYGFSCQAFELPAELFRLVANCDYEVKYATTTTSYSSSEDTVDAASIYVRLFILLLRAQAESMPQNDPDITRWAQRLLTCQDRSRTDRAFAQWVLDWSSRKMSIQQIDPQVHRGKGTSRKAYRPMFEYGAMRLAPLRRNANEMLKRFEAACAGEVAMFEAELDAIDSARSVWYRSHSPLVPTRSNIHPSKGLHKNIIPYHNNE